MDMSSGYIKRALTKIPKQGEKIPWRLYQNYIKDMFTLRFGKLDDGVLMFKKVGSANTKAEAEDRKL
jgi:hypothetical protein